MVHDMKPEERTQWLWVPRFSGADACCSNSIAPGFGQKFTAMRAGLFLCPDCRQYECRPQGYLMGREPAMRISTSLLALGCQSGLADT